VIIRSAIFETSFALVDVVSIFSCKKNDVVKLRSSARRGP